MVPLLAAIPTVHAQPSADAPAADAPAADAPAADAPAADAPAADAPAADAPAADAGPSAEDLEKAKEHFGKGKELFDAKDFENAVKEFKESYRLSKNPVLLYNIAFTLDEMGDKDMALFYYEKFLRDTQADAPNRDKATERVAEMKKTSSAATGDTGAGAEIVSSFKHIAVEEAPPGSPLDITAVIPEGATWTVTLHYRAAGESNFTAVTMKPRYTELVGRVPANRTNTKSIQYYLEVVGPDGKVIDRSGEPTSPNVIYIDQAAKPRFYPDFDSTGSVSETPEEGNGNSVAGPDGGWTDVRSSKFQMVKWGTTAGAVGFLLISGTFSMLAAGVETDIESASIDSRLGTCAEGPPCSTYSSEQKDLQDKGERYETLGNVSLVVSGVAVLAAGALWYFDLTGDKSSSTASSSISALPVVGDDFVGAAASLRF